MKKKVLNGSMVGRMKRTLLSAVLVVAMVAGLIWIPEGSQSKAADSVTSVTFEKYSGWMGDNGDGSLMFRLATQTSLSSYEGQKLRATVLVDGKEQVVDWIVVQVGTQWTLYSRLDVGNYIASTARSIIVPKGTGFCLVSDGAEVLAASADFAITLISGVWTTGYTDAKFAIRYVGDQSNGDTYVALNVDQSVSDLSTTYSSGNKFNSTVLVNGKEQTVTWEYVISGDAQLIRSSYDVDSSNYISTDATRIEIPEGTYLIHQSAAKMPIRVTSEVVLTELGTSNWVEGCIDMGLSYDVVYSGTNFWQVKLKFDGDLSQVTTTTAHVYLDTEIDGTMVEDVAWLINISNGTIYPDGTSPTVPSTATSVKIYAGTYSGGYSGANTTIPIRITNDVGAQYANGTWYNMDNVWMVNAAYSSVANIDTTPQIQLTTDVATPDGWSGWFNGTVYIDGTASKARFYFDASSQSLLIGQQMSSGDTSDTVMAALLERKTVKVLAQTVLTPVQSQPGPVEINLDGDLILEWNETGTSYEVVTQEIMTNVSYKSIAVPEGKDAYQLTLAVDNYEKLVEIYGLWSWFEGTIKVNGEERVVAFQLGSDLFASVPSEQNANAGLPLNTTSFEIPEGTYFTKVGSSDMQPIKVENSISYVNVDGSWYVEGSINLNYDEVSLAELAAVSGVSGSNWSIYPVAVSPDTIPGTPWRTHFKNVVYVVDGTEYTTDITRANNAEGLYMTIPGTNMPITTSGSIVTIKAGKYMSDDGSNGISILEDFVFYVRNGSLTTKYNPEDPSFTSDVNCNLDYSTYVITDADTVTIDGSDYAYGTVYATPGVHELKYVLYGKEYTRKLVLYRYGDLDDIGDVRVRDLMIMKKHLYSAEYRPLSEAGAKGADLNSDNTIDANDTTLLRQILIGKAIKALCPSNGAEV